MYNSQFFTCPYYMNQATYPSFNEWRRANAQKFAAVSGTVTRIEDFNSGQDDVSAGCYKLMSLESNDKGPVNFVIFTETYFVDHEVVEVGDEVT